MDFNSFYNSVSNIIPPFAIVTGAACAIAWGYRAAVGQQRQGLHELRLGLIRPDPANNILFAASKRWPDAGSLPEARRVEAYRTNADKEDQSRQSVEELLTTILKIGTPIFLLCAVIYAVTFFYKPPIPVTKTVALLSQQLVG
jgi:hypothetical protein